MKTYRPVASTAELYIFIDLVIVNRYIQTVEYDPVPYHESTQLRFPPKIAYCYHVTVLIISPHHQKR